jgi:hypothetical protein
MKKILIGYIAFLLFCLLACTSNIENVSPKYFANIKEKIVMTSFISPQDTVIYVNLTLSAPVGSNQVANRVVKDAIVTLSTDNQQIIIPYQDKKEFYSISAKAFKIEAGKTYTLKAVTKDKEVEASTTIPLENVKIENYFVTPTTKQEGRYNDTLNGYRIQFKWQDVSKKVNYYKATAEFYYQISEPTYSYENNAVKVTYEPKQKLSNISNYLEEESYFDDLKFDGKLMASQIGEVYIKKETFMVGKTIYRPKDFKPTVLRLQLFNLSKEFYDYHLSLFSSEIAYENPFAEPVFVFTNVKNGLGCFAGYNKTEIVLSY